MASRLDVLFIAGAVVRPRATAAIVFVGLLTCAPSANAQEARGYVGGGFMVFPSGEMERLGDFLLKHIEGIAAYCDHQAHQVFAEDRGCITNTAWSDWRREP